MTFLSQFPATPKPSSSVTPLSATAAKKPTVPVPAVTTPQVKLPGAAIAGAMSGMSASAATTPRVATPNPMPTTASPTSYSGLPGVGVVASSAALAADKVKSAQDWINNPASGQGGMSAYTAAQRKSYENAVASGDNNLVDRLKKDSLRVGYSLNDTSRSADNGPVDYYALAKSEYDKKLSELGNNAAGQKAGLTAAWDRSNEIQQGNRTLDDLKLDRTLNPFSGQTSYAQGIVGRERALADENARNTYLSAMASIDSELADANNQATDAIASRAYQLEQDAKQYGLNYADRFGLTPGGTMKTLAARGQDFNQALASKEFDQGVKESDRTFDYQVKRDQIADAQWQKEFDEDVRQFGVDDAWRRYQEKQVQARASGNSSGGSNKATLVDVNMPTTVSSMASYIKSKLPGSSKSVQGPLDPQYNAPNGIIENLILSNPNLTEKQYAELYTLFGVPIPK